MISGRSGPISTDKPVSFSRHVRELFIFLIVLVAASNVSGLFLLDRIVRSEDSRVAARLSFALEQVRRQQTPVRTGEMKASDLSILARDAHLDDLIIAYTRVDHGSLQWQVIRSMGDTPAESCFSPFADTPQMPETGWGAGGEFWRYLTVDATWDGRPARLCAGLPAPVLGGLRRQFRLEIWVRGFIITGFILFALLFHRIVLLPFRDMRRRASVLVESGILPEAPGHPTDDPEYVIFAFDVLARRLIEEADTHRQRAAKSEKHARSVERFNEYMLSSMSTGVLILGRDGAILRANRAAEQILRTAIPAMIGQQYQAAELYPEMIAVIEEGLKYGQLYSRREMRVDRNNDKGALYLGVNTSLIRNEFDEVIGLSILMTDLTEIKRLHDDLAENQRLADLGEMAAGLAHQLRNSMAAILGYGKLLRDMIGPDTRSSGWVDSVIGETEETAQMLERFLSFARPLTGDHEPIDLESVVTEAIETTGALARNRNIRVSLHVEISKLLNHCVMGDSLLLKQVFINLLQNGIEAMADGGEISVRISPLVPATSGTPRAALAGLAARQNGNGLTVNDRGAAFRVEIADQGSGIPEGDRAQIFRPFFTSKETGTGLGLPLAKKIAAFHGGNLTLERSGPDGSVFLVTLPAQRVPGESCRGQERAEIVATQGC